MVGGKAAGRAAEGIIAKAVKDLFRVVAKDAAKDAARDAAKDAERAAERDAARAAGRDAGRDLEHDAARPLDRVTTCGDPVDVVTGAVVQHEVDADLPGLLPLVLSRTHRSSYRLGRWFGPSWASTLDQRLEVEAAGVRYLGEDGMVLRYRRRAGGGVVAYPVSGPRLRLGDTTAGGYSVADTERGRTLLFAQFRTATGTQWPLVAVTDRNGHRIDVDRDGDGNLTAVRHSGGYHVTVETAGGRVVALYLADRAAGGLVPLRRFGYDGRGNLAEVVDSAGRPMRLEYDGDGRLTGWTDRNGVAYRYEYDPAGRCVRATGSGGYLNIGLSYDAERRVTTAVDSLGHPTEYHLNDRGQVVREVDPLGAETRSDWDERDRLLARTDPLGHTTRYAYDPDGRLVAVLRPDGARSTAAYGPLGPPVTVVDPDGAVWRRKYDERGNLTAETDPTGAVTRYGYDERGHLVAVTDALGQVTRAETDAAGVPVAMTDPLGATTRWRRDTFGRVAAVTDSAGGTTAYGWSVEGDLVQRTLPDGATERWSYDGEGNLVDYTDAAGQRTSVLLGPFDRPAEQVGPVGDSTRFGYDTELRLTAVTNPQGLVWRYEYDPAGRLVAEIDFTGRTMRYGYDAAGRLRTSTNGAGQTTRYVRDALGNAVEQDTDGVRSSFEYDPAGRLVHAAAADSDLRLEYDPVGRLVAETYNGRTLTSRYDPLGRRVQRRTPSGAVSGWEYRSDGQPVALHTGGRAVRFGYDHAGREVARRTGPVLLTQSSDGSDRLLSQVVTAGGFEPGQQPRLVQRRGYSYGRHGYLAGVDDHLAGPRRYAVDPAGRVTAVDGPGWTERYAYDGAGNLVESTGPPAVLAEQGRHEYAGALLTGAGGVRYQHDAQGRVIVRRRDTGPAAPETWQYTWDGADRLVGVGTPDGGQWRYRYDPLGRRVAKQRLAPDGSVAEQVDFVWDGVLLAEQVHAGRTTVWDWDPAGVRPLTQVESSQTDRRFYAIVSDLVGTPTELVDGEDGALAWRLQGTVWGATPPPGPGADCSLRFPGQYHDRETGLHYNYFRYYDPGTARYGSPDPLGLSPSFNPYGYVHNPAQWRDPLGLTPCRVGRRGALNQAKRDLGIPRGQHPESINRVRMTDKWGRPVLDENGRRIITREYTYVRPGGDRVVVQDHSAGHAFGEGGVGDQGPHFNVRPPDETRTGHVPGTSDHYPFGR